MRPLPARPRGPVEPDEALSRVRARLPALDEPAAAALALVALAGRPRGAAAAERGESEEQLGASLARARKALRRELRPLPGSGWCERAERIISDRIDGVAGERATRILSVHLLNCGRCAEHERRLVQAQDALLGELGGAAERVAPGRAAGPALHVVAEASPQPAPTAAPPREDAAAEAAAAAVRPLRSAAAGAAWNLATVVAVALALVSAAVAVAGALGASVRF